MIRVRPADSVAGHVVFDESLSRVLNIAASLMETPIWAFWWD